MAKTPVEKIYEDVAEVTPIVKYEKENSKSIFRFRLIRASTEPFLRFDIREAIESKNYSGFTARGVTFSADQVPKVIQQLQQLQKKFVELFPEEAKATKKSK
jgi:hypothetical protein